MLGLLVTIYVLFKYFKGYIDKTAKNNIWIQGEKDGEGIWRFHDGSNLPDYLKRDMFETDLPYELHLRYVIDKQQFWDGPATLANSFICEHRIY